MTDRNQAPQRRIVAVPIDGRQSQAASDIQRGVIRLLANHGFASLPELPLGSGRRADVVGLSASGEIWIVEIKSGPQDYRADVKWQSYQDYCDRYYFAVAPDFPDGVLPDDVGLIYADRFGGDIVREGEAIKLAGARRKAMMLRFARAAAQRLTRVMNPDLKTRLEIGDP